MAAALPTTITPTFEGLSKSTTVRVLKTDFGDGYSQRAADGINSLNREYSIEWVGSDTNIEALITHFEERAGYQSFTWTPAGESTSYKWTCEEWNRQHLTDDTQVLTASLKQVYDL